MSSGYWFVAPYEHVFRPAPLPAWVGPHIYDSTGDLVWSGASMFQGSDSYDFRMSDFGEEKLMTFAYRDDCAAVFMDTNYKVKKEGRFARDLGDLNMHDLNVIENGTRALVLTKQGGIATEQMSKDVGLEKDLCHAAFDGFKVMDTTKDQWEPVFEWSTFDHIPLWESTYTNREIESLCSTGWDYLHLNSVDKCPDGNYLLSARHSDTIYNINGTDGSIIWRLGGKLMDFQQNFRFSRQHDIRCRAQDIEAGTYTISFLDNAKGHDSNDATNEYSRGLIVDLDTRARPMTARVQHEYAHPEKGFATSRGNLEVMENGNVFVGWAKQLLQSEYTAEGKLVMEAKLVPEFLGTYRAYKFPFQGDPSQPPDVHSEVFSNPGAGPEKLTTHVYVSWNGATNVDEWRVYRSDSSAAHRELIGTAKRTSFETLITVEGYVSYIVVEAFDSWDHGMWHGKSGVVMTVRPADWASTSEAMGIETPEISKARKKGSWVATPVATFLAGFASMGLLLLVAWYLSRAVKKSTLLSKWRRRRGLMDYLPLAESEKEAEARDTTPSIVLRNRERSESKLESATSVAPLPLHKSMHRRGDSIQRTGRPMPLTP